jgi:VanZ family protein
MLKQLTSICLLGLAQELIWIATCALGLLREHMEAFLGLMLAAFALCIWSFFRLPAINQRTAVLVVGFGLLFRVTLLPAQPYQSEDVYRYLWDARVASAGINPFLYPPNAPELEGLRDAKLYPMINSKPHVTSYPPLSQILFRACYTVFKDNVTAMKAVFSLCEFAALLVSWKLLTIFGQNLRNLLLVAWNPFIVFEFSHSGHSDSLMMFLILLSIYLLCRSKNVWAMVSYAGAVLSKLHPALWFPLYLRRVHWKAAVGGLAAGAVLTYPYFDPLSGVKYLNSLGSYFRLFEFNASIHYLLRYMGRVAFHQQWDQTTGPYLAALLLIITLLVFWKFPLHNGRALLQAGFWIMTADLLLATTVHPWYISWAALALPFFPYAFMTYWTGACFLSYMAYAYRPVYEPAWILLVEYLPLYGLMAWEISRRAPLLDSPTKRHHQDTKNTKKSIPGVLGVLGVLVVSFIL